MSKDNFDLRIKSALKKIGTFSLANCHGEAILAGLGLIKGASIDTEYSAPNLPPIPAAAPKVAGLCRKAWQLSTGTGGRIPPEWVAGLERNTHLLLESKTISPDAMGEWLRRHGLHTGHIQMWEQELTTIANGNERKEKNEAAKLRKENPALKKELARKEKALAEAAVLLTQKNFSNLFEDNGEA